MRTPDRDRHLAGKFAAKQRMARYREWKKKQEKDDERDATPTAQQGAEEVQGKNARRREGNGR